MQSAIFRNGVNRFLLIFFCFFLFSSGWAQESAYKTSFGIKAGAGFTSMRGGTTDDYGATFSYNGKTSVSAGLRLFVPTGKNGLFIPEMIVILKGVSEQRTEQANSPYPYNYYHPHNLFYVELPLNMTYKKVTKTGQFFIGGGPAPALHFIEQYLGNAPIRSFDLGLNALAGYQFPIGFSVELNYTHGLLKINSNPNSDLKSSNVGFSLGYAF
jgi:hypothetical protein